MKSRARHVVAALEGRLPDAIENRIYNCFSARDLVEAGMSEDIELRLFETGWAAGEAVSHCEAVSRQMGFVVSSEKVRRLRDTK